MYNKTKLGIRLPRGTINFFTSNIGLKQVCNLSPILFNLFIGDILEIFDQTFDQSASLLNLQLNYFLYADDLILISETSSSLQNCLNRLQSYCQKCKLNVIIKRTKIMIIPTRQSSAHTHSTFENKPLHNCKSYTYLGSIVSNNGSFKMNINELCKSASRTMYSLAYNHLSSNVHILTHLFDKMIIPICTYNCEVWRASSLPKNFSPNYFLSDKQCRNPL